MTVPRLACWGLGMLAGDKVLEVTNGPNLVNKVILLGPSNFLKIKKLPVFKNQILPPNLAFWQIGSASVLTTVSWGSDAAALPALEVGHVSSSLPRSPCSRNDTCFPSSQPLLGPQRHLSLRPWAQVDMETSPAHMPSRLEAERP